MAPTMFGRLSRRVVLVIALFVTVDALVCPVMCLVAGAESHQASSSGTQGTASLICGACSAGTGPLQSYLPTALVLVTDCRTLPIDPPCIAPVGDIDHPPRLA